MQLTAKRGTAQHSTAQHSTAQHSTHETPTCMDKRLPVSRKDREAIELGGAQCVHHGVYSFHSLEANHRTRHDLQAMQVTIPSQYRRNGGITDDSSVAALLASSVSPYHHLCALNMSHLVTNKLSLASVLRLHLHYCCWSVTMHAQCSACLLTDASCALPGNQRTGQNVCSSS